jgi:rhodanese-related sulfurtransferase
MRSINLLLGLAALACLLFQACVLGQDQVQEDQDKVDLMNKQMLSDKKTVTTSYKGQPWATSSLNDSNKKTTSAEYISPVQVSSALGQSSDYMVKTDSFLKEAKNNGFYLLSVADFLSISNQDKNWAIVDVRTPQQYLVGHIPDALNIPLENLISQMGTIPAGRKVAVYSATDTDAAFAVQTLRVYGDREASILQGGIVAWQAAGMTVVT